jgi:alpha-beta hydrolase superfamily lysophospholipase
VGSSGGLTVLGVLADHPDLVAGGIASYPVSDLAALADAPHRFEAHYTDTLVGPSRRSGTGERMRALSPIHRAERITGPLLLFHGTDDPVVPIAQSELLVGGSATRRRRRTSWPTTVRGTGSAIRRTNATSTSASNDSSTAHLLTSTTSTCAALPVAFDRGFREQAGR